MGLIPYEAGVMGIWSMGVLKIHVFAIDCIGGAYENKIQRSSEFGCRI
jgi:hypothetical protein